MPAKPAMRATACIVVAAALTLCPSIVHAATITGLFNTGVNGLGNAFGSGGVPDPHYGLVVQPGASTAQTVTDTTFPFPPWFPNNGFSRWIGPDATGFGPAGNYVYRTTFNLPANAILSTASIFGLWGTDDPSVDIYINGNPTGNVSPGFTSLGPFSVTSGFQFGLNTLDFSLNNVISVTGLRVDRIVGSYQVVPEPVAMALAAIGAAVAGCFGHVRRTSHSREAATK
jgi:hypothetical protein